MIPILGLQVYSVFVNPSQPSPILQLDIRCDRITCENKGGVMICIPRKIQPLNISQVCS